MNYATDLIKKRWSPVAFSDKPVGKQLLMELFENARWAPSSRNRQPWRFIFGEKGDDIYPVLFDLVNDANQVWAKTAPVLVLVVAETVHPTRKTTNRFAFYDSGMAVANLLFSATEKDLYVHQMGGYNVEGAVPALGIPEGHEPVAMIAIGYKGEPSQLPAEVAERERNTRTRNSVDTFVFNGRMT